MKNGIIKRGSSYSYVVRERNPATGKTKPRWVGGFSTHAEASAARDQARVDAARGTTQTPSRVLVADYLRGWVEAVQVRPKTRDGYRYNVEHYVLPRLGGTALRDVRPATLTGLYAGLRADGGRNGQELGWRSVQSIHRTLSSALSAAVDQQLLPANPAERARLPVRPSATTRLEREDEDIKVFNPQQLEQFLSTAKQHRLYSLLQLAAHTGCRRGELLHLRWEDFDIDGRELSIKGSRSVVAGKSIEGPTKGGRSRIISLDEQTVVVLREHRAAQVRERLHAGALWVDQGDYIFRQQGGSALHPDTPSKLMPKLCGQAEVPRRRFHDLRHTHATILLSAGIPPHEVAQRLGHRDATITLQIYAKVLRERASGLGDAFAEALRRPF